MRYAAVVLLFSVSITANLLADPPGPPSPERVHELLTKLGSPKFAQREQAARELQALGPAVLPALRQALTVPGGDSEVRHRIELLARKLEDQQLQATLLSAKRVRLNLKNATVAEALRELARQSGNAVDFSDYGELAGRKITLDTGETTFWDALDRLCKEVGLAEGSVQTYTPYYGRKGFKGKAWQPKVIFAPGVHLTPVTSTEGGALPTCNTGVVRVRAQQTAAVTSEGQIEVVLEVTGEPRLLGFCEAGALQVVKAVDDRGQVLRGVPPPPADYEEPLGKFGLNKFGGLVIAFGNVINGVPFGNSPAGAAGPYQTTLRVVAGKEKAKKITELTGKLVVQTAVEDEPRLVVDNILQAEGKIHKDHAAGTFTVLEVKRLADGTVRLMVIMENDAGLNGKGGNIVLVGAQGQSVEVNGGTSTVSGRALPIPVEPLPRLRDAAGNEFALVEATSEGLTISNSQISQTLTVVYRPQGGQGPPARLVLPGQRILVFEVPFTLRDIVLP